MRINVAMIVCIGIAVMSYAKPIEITKVGKYASVSDGLIKINGVDHGVVSVSADISIDKPTKISMKMRRLAISQSKPGHFGVELLGGDGFKAHFYSHDGANFIATLSKGKIKYGTNASKGMKKVFPVEKDAQWVDVALYLQPKMTELHVDGKPQGFVRGNLLPLRRIALYGYHNEIEVKDMETSPLSEAEKISGDPNPSFQASFDENLAGATPNGKLAPSKNFKVSLVPGLTGKAVRVSAKVEKPSPIKAHHTWKPVDGALESRGKNKGPFTIDVPELTEATIRFKIKRLKVPNAGQHCGIVLSGKDCSISFYSNGPLLLYLLKDKKETIAHKSLGKVDLPEAGDQSPWNQFELKLSQGKIEASVNGKVIGEVAYGFPPITHVGYYNYRLDTAIDDIEIESPKFSFKEDFTNFVNPQDPPVLEYETKDVFANHGTLMFWVKSDWDGKFSGNMPIYPFFAGFNEEGKQKASIDMSHWVTFVLGRTGDLRGEVMKRDSRKHWYRGDWNHVVMVWSDGGWCKAFLNGLPYQQPFGYNGKVMTNLDLKSIERFTLGTGTRNAGEADFDDLKIYKRPLDNGEIYDEYRKFMPVDLLVDRAVINADKADEVVVLAAPGGYYMHPIPAKRPLTIGKVDIQLKLFDVDEKVVAEKDYSLDMTEPTELKLPVENLPAGKYRLKCNIGPVQRSFEIVAYKPLAPVKANNEELELGEVIFEKNLKDDDIVNSGGVKLVDSKIGEYLEAGACKGQRFSFEVPFAEKYLDGRPVLIEVEWPDDKPRSMGLYMYPESKRPFHRDRLGGGIQSGVEYPLTNRMRKTRYLFFPGLKNYLFEARTMAGKYPAAIAVFRIYEIKNERLPKLAINYPEGLPGRQFGYLDEDETADQNLGWDYKDRNAQNMTERFLDYLDYTGQNTWQYPFMRYTGYSFPMEGSLHNGLYPYDSNAFRYMVDAFTRRGKTIIPNFHLFTLPEMKMLPDTTEEWVKKGWPLTKYNDPPVQPNKYTRPNHANPEVRDMLCRHVKETARRYGNLAGVDGLNFSVDSIGFFSSLEYGYDDYTVNLFSKETGVKVPGKSPAERYEFLTKQPQLGEWINWRSEQSVKLFRQMRKAINEVAPHLNLYLGLAAIGGEAAHDAKEISDEKENLLEEIKSIPKVFLVSTRNVTTHRWRLHFGRPINGCDDVLFDPVNAAKFMNGKRGFVDAYHSYFETFNGSLKNDRFASYFQNSDVKPFGRYFLKELAFAVAAMDAQRVLVGSQQLGTWGRDAEAREFAKAYCALPAIPFENAPGIQDPVTVRFLNTEKGSYLYAVSMLWGDCECTLTLSPNVALKDLVTGEEITNGQIKLKPFELRSFYSANPALKVTDVKITVSKQVREFYQKRLETIANAITKLKAGKIDSGDAEKILEQMRKLFEAGRFAELHRVAFSLPIRDVLEKAVNFVNFAEQAEMASRGHYAVNCGSTGFYKAKNGTLFFPDQALSKGKYGYEGEYTTVTRNTDGLKTDDPELFMTESYSIDSYKFKVPAGKYKVRLYMRAAFKRGFKPDNYVFNVDIQGKRVLDNFDLVTHCKSDYNVVAVEDFDDVVAKDGWIEVKFTNDDKHHPSVKMLNAIEVIPEH